jgi:hypothetical protein
MASSKALRSTECCISFFYQKKYNINDVWPRNKCCIKDRFHSIYNNNLVGQSALLRRPAHNGIPRHLPIEFVLNDHPDQLLADAAAPKRLHPNIPFTPRVELTLLKA